MAMSHLSRLFLITIVVASTSSLGAQTIAPKCDGIGSLDLESEPNLAEVPGPDSADAFYPWKDCSPDRGECEKGHPVLPKQPVEVMFVRGDWTCVYVPDVRGLAVEWVQSARLSPLVPNPGPPLTAWLGTWWLLGANRGQGSNRLVIGKAAMADTLRVHGNAYWYGPLVNGRPVTHLGGVDGEAKPEGNHLRIVDNPGSPASCEVAMRLIGQYLIVADNSRCGGMNVRFSGLWQK
jgi:hypothetical protein